MEINDIIDFSEKFGLTYRDYPRKLSDEEKRFRIVCMFEEVQEYADAETMEDELDALVELVYFALGTCYRHGYCFESAWQRVHEANMKKERAQNKSESKRDFELDVMSIMQAMRDILNKYGLNSVDLAILDSIQRRLNLEKLDKREENTEKLHTKLTKLSLN